MKIKPFTESNNLLKNPSKLRKRLRDDGYLFLKGIIPQKDVLDVRQKVLEILNENDWLKKGTKLMKGLTDHTPIHEGTEAHIKVYKKIQSLEGFHRLKLHNNVKKIMEDIFEEPVIPFPQTIGRIAFPKDNLNRTHPHQDWIFVGGSTESISCWTPLGETPIEVGGLTILEGSHKAGFLQPSLARGPGHRTVDIDPELDWVQSDYENGDLLLFKMLTIHAAAENKSENRLRISIDFRYTGESHVINDEWMIPHFSPDNPDINWDVLESEWKDSPTAHYWERLPKMKLRKHKWWWDSNQVGRNGDNLNMEEKM